VQCRLYSLYQPLPHQPLRSGLRAYRSFHYNITRRQKTLRSRQIRQACDNSLAAGGGCNEGGDHSSQGEKSPAYFVPKQSWLESSRSCWRFALSILRSGETERPQQVDTRVEARDPRQRG